MHKTPHIQSRLADAQHTESVPPRCALFYLFWVIGEEPPFRIHHHHHQPPFTKVVIIFLALCLVGFTIRLSKIGRWYTPTPRAYMTHTCIHMYGHHTRLGGRLQPADCRPGGGRLLQENRGEQVSVCSVWGNLQFTEEQDGANSLPPSLPPSLMIDCVVIQ